MNRKFFTGMTLAGLACVLPTVAEAQMFSPVGQGQASCVITRPRPVVSTQLRPQQVTTFCDVTETQVCQKQVVENVPVTTCKNVTVDEGGYKMVWVPKPVTKQVAETTYQQRIKTVSVPTQVTRRVPQVSTQMVPVQTVQYVNETVPVQMTAFASSCDSCGGGGPSIGSSVFAPQLGFNTPQYQVAPYTSAMVPSMPAITVPPYQTALSPSAGVQAPPVPSRSSEDEYETVPARGVPAPKDETVVPPRKTSKFSRVPSAAAVWQSQGPISR